MWSTETGHPFAIARSGVLSPGASLQFWDVATIRPQGQELKVENPLKAAAQKGQASEAVRIQNRQQSARHPTWIIHEP